MLEVSARREACLAFLFQVVGLRDGGLVVFLEEGEVDARANGEDVQEIKQWAHQVMVAAQV